MRTFNLTLATAVLFLAACSEAPTDPETDITPEYGFSNPSGMVVVGDLPDLDGYCRSLGFAGSGYMKGYDNGPQAAFGNWVCHNGVDPYNPVDPRPINMTMACQVQWERKDVQAHPVDPDDAFSWLCYAPKSG